MSFVDDEGLPDMEHLHKTNDLIPDPAKLRTRVIPAEDIAGWFLPFEIVFGMVYWESMGIYLLLALMATILFGWIIPMQQRYALLAKSEFLKEKTQLGHLTWDEQCEILKFEPILEPAWKMDEHGNVMKHDDDPIPDDLDLEDWASELDLDDKIIEHDDGMLSEIHTLDNRYIATLFQTMYEKRMNVVVDPSFSHDKIGWFANSLGKSARTTLNGLKWTGKKMKGAGGRVKVYAPILKGGARKGASDFGGWMSTHKTRFIVAVIVGFSVILFGNWLMVGLRFALELFGWVI